MALDRLIAYVDARTGFDRWGPHANPLIARELRRTGQLSLRECLWLAFGSGLLGLAIRTLRTLTAASDVTLSDGLILVTIWVFEIIMPYIVAIQSAAWTYRTVRLERFELVWIMPLSNLAVVWALMFTALYRLRYALVAVIALMPYLVIEMFRLFVMWGAFLIHYQYDPPSRSDIITPTLYSLVIVCGLWGMNVLAAAVGVQAAMYRRHTSIAILVAPVSVLMIMVCPAILCVGFAPAVPPDSAPITQVMLLGVLLGVLVAPYVLTISLIHTTANMWRR